MKHLFSPFRIKNLDLKNRIVMPSIASFFTESGGRLTGVAVEHYRRRAAGGAAMVTMEACSVSPEGTVSPYQTCIYDDRYIELF
jgi:NADPH2 dehydrogenase